MAMNRRGLLRKGAVALLAPLATAQRGGNNCNCTVAADGTPLDTGISEIQPVIERYEVELRNLNRVYALPGSPLRQQKLREFYTAQLQLLEKVNFDGISQAGRVDYLLLRDRLLREQKQLGNEVRLDAEVAALIP